MRIDHEWPSHFDLIKDAWLFAAPPNEDDEGRRIIRGEFAFDCLRSGE